MFWKYNREIKQGLLVILLAISIANRGQGSRDSPDDMERYLSSSGYYQGSTGDIQEDDSQIMDQFYHLKLQHENEDEIVDEELQQSIRYQRGKMPDEYESGSKYTNYNVTQWEAQLFPNPNVDVPANEQGLIIDQFVDLNNETFNEVAYCYENIISVFNYNTDSKSCKTYAMYYLSIKVPRVMKNKYAREYFLYLKENISEGEIESAADYLKNRPQEGSDIQRLVDLYRAKIAKLNPENFDDYDAIERLIASGYTDSDAIKRLIANGYTDFSAIQRLMATGFTDNPEETLLTTPGISSSTEVEESSESKKKGIAKSKSKKKEQSLQSSLSFLRRKKKEVKDDRVAWMEARFGKNPEHVVHQTFSMYVIEDFNGLPTALNYMDHIETNSYFNTDTRSPEEHCFKTYRTDLPLFKRTPL